MLKHSKAVSSHFLSLATTVEKCGNRSPFTRCIVVSEKNHCANLARFHFKMENIGEDILLHIFSFLDAKTLSSISSVCHYWSEVSNSNFLWKSLVDRLCRKRKRKMCIGRAETWKARFAQIVTGRLYPRAAPKNQEIQVPFETLRASLLPVGESRYIELSVPSSKKRQTIREFVESRGNAYIVGQAFYQHTKSETISNKKKLILKCRETGRLYTGPCVRRMLGLTKEVSDWNIQPSSLDVRVTQDFHVFVQSTSVNRVLVGNTKLLLLTS